MSSEPMHEKKPDQPSANSEGSNHKDNLKAFFEPTKLEQLRPKLGYQTGILAAFALIASVLLGFADLVTRDEIQLRLEEDLKASLDEVIPSDMHDNDLLADNIAVPSADANIGADKTTVYLAKKQGEIAAVCFKLIAPDGYSGPISMVMGIDKNGEILGVRIIAHTETPGLGDKIEITKSKWVLGFNGRSLDNLSNAQWAVKKDGGVFDQFAGATITPRKTVQAIKRGLEFFRAHRKELLETKP